MIIQRRVRRMLELLNKVYGRPRPPVRSEPVDELVRTILSQNTNDRNSLGAFWALKERFKDWDALLKPDTHKIARIIKHAGLANIKAERIRAVLKEIKGREGGIDLGRLETLSMEDALGYLRSLNGVGPKTAACVLLFAFGRPTMPVDTHIYRVSGRLGLIEDDVKIEEAHEILSRIVPKALIYEFHLGIIEHGRRTCRAKNPRCGACVLYGLCQFKDKACYRRIRRERAKPALTRQHADDPMIRKANVIDVKKIQKLINFYAKKDEMLPRSLNELYENIRDFWVCAEGKNIVGTCAIHIDWEDLAEIKSLAVSAKKSGRGIGRRLLERCLGDARALKVRKVFALTYVPKFFERYGFKIVDKKKLPHKIWSECIRCCYFPNCKEIAMMREI